MTTEKYEKMASVAQIYKKHCKDLCYSPEKIRTPSQKIKCYKNTANEKEISAPRGLTRGQNLCYDTY